MRFSDVFWALLSVWSYLVIIWLVAVVVRLAKVPVARGAVVAIGLALTFIVAGLALHWQRIGVQQIADLRTQFEAITYEGGDAGVGPEVIIRERNRRLAKIGYCTQGSWWISKDTGEAAVASANSVFYWCGNYGN